MLISLIQRLCTCTDKRYIHLIIDPNNTAPNYLLAQFEENFKRKLKESPDTNEMKFKRTVARCDGKGILVVYEKGKQKKILKIIHSDDQLSEVMIDEIIKVVPGEQARQGG